MDDAERQVFERGLRHAVQSKTGMQLDLALEEMGWPDALQVDAADAVAILFELQGSVPSTSSALERVLAHCLGLEAGPSTGLVLPALGEWGPPARRQGGSLHVQGLGTITLVGREQAWVVAEDGDTTVAALVPTTDLVLRPVQGMDPNLGLVAVTGTVAAEHLDPGDVSARWPSAVAEAQRAVGHELVGVSRAMLELARQHAVERVQFGQPIGQFQAVRHRLAETLVAIEAADAVLRAAWEDDSPTTAAVAKSLCGRAARTAARHCQQVLAGIGFTTEHEFHHFARRALVLEHVFGSPRTLTRNFGAQLLEAGRLPDFAPL